MLIMQAMRSKSIGRISPGPMSPGGGGRPASANEGGLRSPLECDKRSPKGWQNHDSRHVGLTIVAALENSSQLIVDQLNANVSVQSIKINYLGPAKFNEAASSNSRDDGELRWMEMGLVWASPPPTASREVMWLPVMDFLSSRHLCRKRLDGKDIYMCRGEKALCSVECRYQQIVSDECQEKCGSKASKSSEISSSAYSGGRLFFTGIMAA